MSKTKNLGIWMDHSVAHLFECKTDPIEVANHVPANIHHKEEHGSVKGENSQHNIQNRNQTEFYKGLADEIRHFDHVLLFGPTEAKSELQNLLKADHHFEKVKIEILTADKMTENQQHAFVKEHFSKN